MKTKETKTTVRSTTISKRNKPANESAPLTRCCRILAGSYCVSTDTHLTKLNNNDLVIGGTGKGKTRCYIMPNIANTTDNSVVVADTKGNLHGEFKELLESRGYTVRCIDFKNLAHSPSGYNPFECIKRDPITHQIREQDIMKLASFLCPINNSKDPFWDHSAQNYLCCAISFLLETADTKFQNMRNLIGVVDDLNSDDFANIIARLRSANPDSYAARCFGQINDTKDSDRTKGSIMSVLRNHLAPFCSNDALHLYNHPNSFHLEEIGDTKTALFVNISDSDSSMYRAVSMFYRNLFDSLIGHADNQPDCRLKVPVHFYLDDFATNAQIDNFDNLISVIRSREISVSIIIQNISQLSAKYGNMTDTIIANCDHTIYLGGADQSTSNYLSFRMNLTPSSVCNLPINEKVYIMESCKKFISVNKTFFDTKQIASLITNESYEKEN